MRLERIKKSLNDILRHLSKKNALSSILVQNEIKLQTTSVRNDDKLQMPNVRQDAKLPPTLVWSNDKLPTALVWTNFEQSTPSVWNDVNYRHLWPEMALYYCTMKFTLSRS